MKNIGRLRITTPSDREIVMTREFDAPRDLVFEAYTTPELLKRWLGVQNNWVFAVCEIDLRPGGKYRYLWRGPDRMEMGMGGTFKEVKAPERIVATEKFDESWYPGEAETTLTLVEKNGRTTLTLTVRYESQAARDAVLQFDGALEGVASGFDTLAPVLEDLKVGRNH
jgi:uncharacterized protein YndB with AHSA1/START domain